MVRQKPACAAARQAGTRAAHGNVPCEARHGLAGRPPRCRCTARCPAPPREPQHRSGDGLGRHQRKRALLAQRPAPS